MLTSLRVHPRATPELIEGLTVAEGFRGIQGAADPESLRADLRRWASDPESWLAVATVLVHRLVGYILLTPPEPGSRWAEPGGVVLEVAFLEVANPYRHHLVLSTMATALVREPAVEDHILVARLLAPYWDRARTHLGRWAYRRLLVRLARQQGFRPIHTGDPAIELNPVSLVIARVGNRVPPEAADRFLKASERRSPVATRLGV